jgi:pimeloyl-ACP methyl ester carboxylesterase
VVLLPVLALGGLHLAVRHFAPPPLEVAFAGRALPVERTVVLPGGNRVAFAVTGSPDGPAVVFVHGTPGRWTDFLALMRFPALAERVRLVGVDRPGWGGSAESGLVTSLERQAAAVAAVLRAHPQNRPAILVGHSLGGAVIARVAMDSPELVDALVIVGGSIDPEQEETTWYQAVALAPVVRWALPEPLVRSAAELVPFRGELERMRPRWDALRLPVTVVHGDEDGLVPPANAGFAERVMTRARLTVNRVPRQGHLIPWQRPELIAEAILAHLAVGRSERAVPSTAPALNAAGR